jgi:hypothetical protein
VPGRGRGVIVPAAPTAGGFGAGVPAPPTGPPIVAPGGVQVVVAPPPGPLVARGTWDRLVPGPRDRTWWSGATFVPLPPPAHFAGRSSTNPVVIPGLPPWTGAQALSRRERAWVREPILRPVLLIGLDDPRQLATRAQLREGILVTRAGRQPPPGQECTECRRGTGRLVFANCISGGIGEKCNNCLYRGHVICSLQE